MPPPTPRRPDRRPPPSPIASSFGSSRSDCRRDSTARHTNVWAHELHDPARATRHLRHGRVDALARVGGGHGGARAGRQRVRRRRRGRLHAAGRRAAPERPGRRPAGAPLAGGRRARSSSARRGPRRARRRSSATATSSGSTLVPGTGPLAAVVPGAFGGWLTMLRDYGTMPLARGAALRDRLRASDGYPVLPQIGDAIRNVEQLFRDEWTTSADVYLPILSAPGTLHRNPQLAATYRSWIGSARVEERSECRARLLVPRLRRRCVPRLPGARAAWTAPASGTPACSRRTTSRLGADDRGSRSRSTTAARRC